MATLREHIYAVKNLVEKGLASDDSNYSERLIGFLLKSTRSQLIKEKLNKYREVSPFSYQTICIPLELQTYHDCSCIPAELGCKILKSTCKIPADLLSKWGSTLTVRLASGVKLDELTITQNNLSQYSQTNKNPKMGFFVEDQHIYVLNSTNLKVVLLSAVWEDPETIKDFCKCGPGGDITDEPCYDVERDEFPIDSELSRAMRLMVLSELTSTYNLRKDTVNNASDGQVTPTQK